MSDRLKVTDEVRVVKTTMESGGEDIREGRKVIQKDSLGVVYDIHGESATVAIELPFQRTLIPKLSLVRIDLADLAKR